MKRLYYLLLQLSLKDTFHGSNHEEASSALKNEEFSILGLKLKFRDLCNLSVDLFQQLDSKFKLLFSALCDVSASGYCEDSKLNKLWATVDELTLILRCCMVSLTLLEFDQTLLLEKCCQIHGLLRVLISFDTSKWHHGDTVSLKNFVSRKCTYSGDECTTSLAEEFVACLSFLEPSNPCHPLLCVVLEVFADELLLHQQLRTHMMVVDSASCTNQRLFTCHFANGGIGSVLEVMSAHFFLSTADEQTFEKFISRLVLELGNDTRLPDLSLNPCISLLVNPVMFSAPKMFHAHLISLISEAIGVGILSDNGGPDLRLKDCYLTAFEKSVFLYVMHMSNLQLDNGLIGQRVIPSSGLGRNEPTFESLIHPLTRDKFNYLFSKLDNLWDSYACKIFFKTNADLLSGSINYMKANQSLFGDLEKDAMMSIMDCIIVRAFPDQTDEDVLLRKGVTHSQDIYLLASILKLMSSSLMQVLWCSRNHHDAGSPKTLKDTSSCREYDHLMSIINCFQRFNVCLPIQKFVFKEMMNQQTRHDESKWMLLHFSGLLSLSFASNIDFLAKGCVSVLMATICLFNFEEAGLLSLRSLCGSGLQSCSSNMLPNDFGKGKADPKSSWKLASKFHEIQRRHLRRYPLSKFPQKSQRMLTESSKDVPKTNSLEDSIEGISEKTCNGEVFLKCILEDVTIKSSDYDDIIDFIECNREKDYSSWLKDRRKYRSWRLQKIAVLRWKKKTKIWKSLKGKA